MSGLNDAAQELQPREHDAPREDAQAAEKTDAFERAARRADELGVVERLLRCAHADTEWRRGVECALKSGATPLGKQYAGGSRVSDVWSNSLLHRQVTNALHNDTAALIQFARACPRLAEVDRDEPDLEAIEQLSPPEAMLAAYIVEAGGSDYVAAAVDRMCDFIEAERADSPAEDGRVAEEIALDLGVMVGQVREVQCELDQLKALIRERERENHDLRKQLDWRVREVSQKDRKAHELRSQLRDAQQRRSDAVAAEKAAQEEVDKLRRRARELEQQATSSRTGMQTVESKLEAANRRKAEEIAGLREQLAAARASAEALEKRARVLEREVDDERDRRLELEETFAAVGLDDVGVSASSLSDAVEALGRFLDGLNAYQDRQRERETERLRLKEAAELERLAATQARMAQQQAEAAWQERERERFEERERALFPDGQIDHILIDGHNLVLRCFEPGDERRSHQWLESMTEKMAERLEERGWASCIHLVFDTPHPANDFGKGHGLRVYFANRDEGGADARIAELLREGNPQARYMIVSTDRKDVWRDGLEYVESAGSDVDFVQVEMLAEYLQAWGE